MDDVIRDLTARLDTLADALVTIANGQECTNFTGPPYCRDRRSGRTRDARYGADRWCDTCIARDALELRAATTDPIPEPECSLPDCPFDRPHYHVGDDEAVFTDDDPHYPDHQWVWVDGNNVDAVVIYREWQRYQRASSERWESESNEALRTPDDPPTERVDRLVANLDEALRAATADPTPHTETP